MPHQYKGKSKKVKGNKVCGNRFLLKAGGSCLLLFPFYFCLTSFAFSLSRFCLKMRRVPAGSVPSQKF
jgi:hypothetical protein